jgi:hypothetical protein
MDRRFPNLKFGRDKDEQFRYHDAYELQTVAGTSRLAIGPSISHCELFLELASCLPEPLRVLYVLVLSRRQQHEEARYESGPVSRQQIAAFATAFSEFLESDGRHHIWIAHPDVGTIVYDRHQTLYAYGPLDAYLTVLQRRGLQAGIVDVPAPHWHRYHPHFDDAEAALIRYWPWRRAPLKESDRD